MSIAEAGSDRSSGSTSGAAIVGAFVPALLVACIYLTIFGLIRNNFRKVYAPRTFLGTIPEKDRTPVSRAEQWWWLKDFRSLSDQFLLQHNSLDAWLFLRFLKLIIIICFAAALLTWPILFPVNATGGGRATQLDKISFSNINDNDHLWAHTVVAWVLFTGIFLVIAAERLQLLGFRQACYLREEYSSRLSARTVLFLNVPKRAMLPENLHETFGEDAERSWPIKNTGDLDDLIEKRNGAAFDLEEAQMDLIVRAVKKHKKNPDSLSSGNGNSSNEEQSLVPKSVRPTAREPPVVGSKVDKVETLRQKIVDFSGRVDESRTSSEQEIPGHGAVFVAFKTQSAAHRAFQEITFQPRIPIEDRYLAVQPKEVLWKQLALPASVRLSKASLALAFVIVFTIFFSIPVGLIGTWSNAKQLANNVSWLEWLNRLPPWVLGLLTGLVPPFLTSWFVSYVPKLFRHIAKLSGEPTVPQAELKTQAWYLTFQVTQIFLVTTISSGTAAVVTKIIQDPGSAPALLAENLPKASNFYLTYFVLQGLASPANNLVDYSELFQYWFYEYIWDKTPRQKFQTYAEMRGTPWAAWYPKFTNFFIIAVAYACIQPLILGFAGIGLCFFYLSYRYMLLYIRQTKTDTKGEAYKRALQQMPTGLYFAELCLIGLFGARGAAAQTTLMIVLLVITAVANLLLDRMLRPLELYLGVDKWQQQEIPLLAEQDGIDSNDTAGLHAASHGRRLGLNRLPNPAPRRLSDFFDSVISAARDQVAGWLEHPSARSEHVQQSEEDISKAYEAPAFTSKTPKLWIPRDNLGVSKEEIQQNEAIGIQTTDEAAEIDEKGWLLWDHNFENVPIYSKPKVI